MNGREDIATYQVSTLTMASLPDARRCQTIHVIPGCLIRQQAKLKVKGASLLGICFAASGQWRIGDERMKVSPSHGFPSISRAISEYPNSKEIQFGCRAPAQKP